MTFALQRACVHEAILRVRGALIHPHFSGYLAILQVALREHRAATVPDVIQFYDRYLRVAEPVEGKPYLQLFWNRKHSEAKLWLNANLQGSYAKSSLRNSPFPKCLEGPFPPFSLSEDHLAIASAELCFRRRISAVACAVALLRDFEFSERPTPEVLVRALREELDLGQPEFERFFDIDDFDASAAVREIPG